MTDQPTKRKGLGKGLSALFEDASETSPASTLQGTGVSQGDDATEEIIFLNPQQFVTGLYQPRHHFDEVALQELSDSIKAQGILHPLVARKNEEGEIQLIAGERRLRAAVMAGLTQIPCRLLAISPKEALEISLLENVQRKDLSPIDEAKGYEKLLADMHYTQETLAHKIGKSRTHLANTLRLLKLPRTVQQLLDNGPLTAGHGRALVGHPQAEKLAQRAQKEQWSVRQTEEAAKLAGHQTLSEGAKRKADQEERVMREEEILGQSLSDMMGLKVRVTLNRKGGILHVAFHDPAQLDTLLQKLTRTFTTQEAQAEREDATPANASSVESADETSPVGQSQEPPLVTRDAS
jgi:ParB family chromosome partitioning protein